MPFCVWCGEVGKKTIEGEERIRFEGGSYVVGGFVGHGNGNGSVGGRGMLVYHYISRLGCIINNYTTITSFCE
jgi:hypothetical protein